MNQGTLSSYRSPGQPLGSVLGLSKTSRTFVYGFESAARRKTILRSVTHEQGAWPILFTHRDLASLNILAHGDNVLGGSRMVSVILGVFATLGVHNGVQGRCAGSVVAGRSQWLSRATIQDIGCEKAT